MSKAIFYRAGSPVCVGAEQIVPDSINQEKFQVESARLGAQLYRPTRLKRQVADPSQSCC